MIEMMEKRTFQARNLARAAKIGFARPSAPKATVYAELASK